MKKTLTSILAAGLFALAGCRTNFIRDDSGVVEKSYPRLKSEFRVGWEPKYYNFNVKESKSVPVHPEDAGFLSGDTDVKAGDRFLLASFTGGYAERLETKKFAVKLGADAELDLNKYVFCQDYTQQASDHRAKSHGSFVYDRIDPEFFSLIPFIGLHTQIGDFNPYIEYGVPIRTFERSWGHYRWNHEEKEGSESDSVTGKKMRIGLDGRLKDTSEKWGLEFSKENYDTKFGKIENYAILFTLKKKF